jgi:putative ABC transport system substrate-binding protein
MKRREFITLLGGTAAAWPMTAGAQQAERMRRIGVLMSVAADGPEGQARLAAFRRGLQQLGWTDGRSVDMDIRWAAGDAERTHRYAGELVALGPDVILASGDPVMALQQATRTVPIVFTIIADPVGAGLVESLARPGGNSTGFMSYEHGFGPKWLELLKEIAPSVKRAAVIRNADESTGIAQFAGIQGVAPALGVGTEPHRRA